MSATIADTRRDGTAALKQAARARGRSLLRSGGARAARLDSGAVAHKTIVNAIGRALPKRFDPDAARGLDTSFELRVRDPRGEPTRFELLISGGRCEVRRRPATSAAATATVGADDLIRLVTGAVGWPELLSSGRLELSGDPFLGLRLLSLFRLPAHASSV